MLVSMDFLSWFCFSSPWTTLAVSNIVVPCGGQPSDKVDPIRSEQIPADSGEDSIIVDGEFIKESGKERVKGKEKGSGISSNSKYSLSKMVTIRYWITLWSKHLPSTILSLVEHNPTGKLVSPFWVFYSLGQQTLSHENAQNDSPSPKDEVWARRCAKQLKYCIIFWAELVSAARKKSTKKDSTALVSQK
eukprot:Gb_29839 [translate_table: standard]